MAPLESVLEAPGSRAPSRAAVERRREPQEVGEPEPRQPARFRVTDVISRRVLVEDADVRTTVDTLQGARSIADVSIRVREPESGEWRLLTLAESKLLWSFRERLRKRAEGSAGKRQAFQK
jgi:hypothetical protein